MIFGLAKPVGKLRKKLAADYGWEVEKGSFDDAPSGLLHDLAGKGRIAAVGGGRQRGNQARVEIVVDDVVIQAAKTAHP